MTTTLLKDIVEAIFQADDYGLGGFRSRTAGRFVVASIAIFCPSVLIAAALGHAQEVGCSAAQMLVDAENGMSSLPKMQVVRAPSGGCTVHVTHGKVNP